MFGPLAMSQAFAPVLGANGGGAIVNVLSVLSWVSMPEARCTARRRRRSWSLTNALRVELLGQGTQVVALHVGYMDTDMTAGVDAPKASPDDVAAQTLAGRRGRRVRGARRRHQPLRAQRCCPSDLTALYPTLGAS